MLRTVLIPALTTGAFCAVFAVSIDAIVSMVSTAQVAMLAATSGFLGSIFASLVWRRKK
jgi:hypothetical protein